MGLGATPGASADLGGNCCADLEERIAELESTTARKGNRKVSLKISGWVNEAVFFWDDGVEQNTYVGTNGMEASRFRFSGEAKIDSEWSAGYIIEVGIQGALSSAWNQAAPASASPNPASGNNTLLARKSAWFLKSKTYGQVAVGLNGTATYHLLDDADPTSTRFVSHGEGGPIFLSAFTLRDQAGNTIGGTPLRWSDALRGFNNSTPGDSGRRNVVRYDTPVFHGVSAAVAWGEDDLWDAVLIYKGEAGDFALTARAGYGASTDFGAQQGTAPTTFVSGGTTCISSSTTAASAAGDFNCSWGGVAATLQHKPTGLFVYGGWGAQRVTNDGAAGANAVINPDSYVWFIQPGIEAKLNPLGKTTFFGEYRKDEAGSNPGKTLSSDIEMFQVGAIQTLDAASANLYIIYQRAGGNITRPTGVVTELMDFQEVVTGMKIEF